MWVRQTEYRMIAGRSSGWLIEDGDQWEMCVMVSIVLLWGLAQLDI
jgi:hypothetical protein